MPQLISRADALARIVAEGGRPPCLMCAIRDGGVGPVHTVYDNDRMLVMLPRYVRRWGHMMVLPKAHVVSYSQIDPALWLEASQLALVAARVVEEVRQPVRCYVASTGSNAGEELIQTSRHLHMHIIPLYDPDDRPRDIFSWSQGVYVAEPHEWEALRDAYRAAWPAHATASVSSFPRP
ncbi:MAG: HIT family protein [Deltaproteobacteria bacterium]|nr:HIT family protein [Deltaproteobacteria bacterium]